MKNTIRLSLAYIRHYKKQAASLFVGIFLAASLLTGIGSLFESGRHAALENARIEYGDWHYNTRGDWSWIEEFKREPEGKGYHLERYGMEKVVKVIEEPFEIQFVYGDEEYLDMMGRTFKEGSYPQKENEIALDLHTLKNLNIPEVLGSEVVLDGETFILSGILTDMPEKLSEFQGEFMQVFVNSTLDYDRNGSFLYLKFDEKSSVYPQAKAFVEKFGIEQDAVARNNGIVGYVGGEAPPEVFQVIKEGLKDPKAGLPYIWGQLNSDGILAERIILLALALFGTFIIYSLFQISVLKRTSQYSVMQTLGMTDARTFSVLLTELCMIFLVGYPAGCVAGNGAAALIYQKAGRIFITQNQTYHTGDNGGNLKYAAVNLPDAGKFQVNLDVMLGGAVFFILVLTIISVLLIRRMRKLTIRQMIAKDTGKAPWKRRIYSIRHSNLTGILTRKFMFSRKGTFIGILLSLSVGSIIFLGAAYVTENTQKNNELTFKADDGLGSDIQVYEDSDQIGDVIPEETIAQIEKTDGLKAVHPVRYLLGEVPFPDGTFTWKEFFAELSGDETWKPDAELMEKYNGMAVQTGEDDYAIKVNIYGYDDEMLKELDSYLLEGGIEPDQMRRENSVILKTLMDGQGNYDGVKVKPGDDIKVKTISSQDVPQEALKFLGSGEWYQEKTLEVAAVTSRQLAKVDTYIGDGDNASIDIIMTNEQMKENFGVAGYQTVSITLKEGADSDKIAEELKNITEGIHKCTIKDYSRQIEAQNFYLKQKMMFFYGIAFVLFGISILHIMNSMQYLVAYRKHEFGIMRAMGITDRGFLKMLAKEGLRYGIYSSLLVVVLYFFVQKALYYFMVHVYLYLHPGTWVSWTALAAVILLNMLVCIAATLASGKKILKEEIIEVI